MEATGRASLVFSRCLSHSAVCAPYHGVCMLLVTARLRVSLIFIVSLVNHAAGVATATKRLVHKAAQTCWAVLAPP